MSLENQRGALPDRPSRRISSLDGLRGLAALIVVIYHALLTSPQFSRVHFGDAVPVAPWMWLFTWSPLHLVWAGSEAVTVFFVLSGFVLALPYRLSASPDWDSYYQRRFIRLYVPVVAAVLLSTPLVFVPSRSVPTLGSRWLLGHQATVIPHDVAMGMLLAFGYPGAVNHVLWSLRWEVIFSALLPAYLAGARLFAGRPVALIVACTLAIGVGGHLQESLVYLPIFMLGTALAFLRVEEIQTPAAFRERSTVVLETSLGLVLILAKWLVTPWFQSSDIVGALNRTLPALGALMLVDGARRSGPVSDFFDRPTLQWLGSRSYSLYLVHDPIVTAIGFALRTPPNPLWFVPVSAGIAIVAAELFYRGVERPSLRLAARASGR